MGGERVRSAAQGSWGGLGSNCACSPEWTSVSFLGGSGGIKAFLNTLSLFSPTSLPRIHFEEFWLQTGSWICTLHGQPRQKKGEGGEYCSGVRQPETACHTPSRIRRSQSSDSIHQARQRERQSAAEEGGRVQK